MSLGLLYVDKKLIYDLSFKEIQDLLFYLGLKDIVQIKFGVFYTEEK